MSTRSSKVYLRVGEWALHVYRDWREMNTVNTTHDGLWIECGWHGYDRRLRLWPLPPKTWNPISEGKRLP